MAVVFVLGLVPFGLAQADDGASIFKKKCASCHGADGQGAADGYEKPLYGDLSITALTQLIERTMPESDPEECVGEEARKVAEYIHQEFYSLEARQKKGLAPKPRIELARLTVQQHRNAVADLVGRFKPTPRSPSRRRGSRRRRRDPPRQDVFQQTPQPGLRAEYYQSEGMSKADELRRQRVDHRIDFDFQQKSPTEGITPDQFAIIWKGALIANETGYYEFRVSTPNGARLYLNMGLRDRRRKLRDDSSVAGQSALIDAWVSSGKMRQRSARVFLLGGREYPLRFEFFKYLDKAASIKLEWKPPRGAWSVLDHHHLTTALPENVFVLDTPFPADDRSFGYERGASISRQWHVATTEAAIAVANEMADRLPLLVQLEDNPDWTPEVRDAKAAENRQRVEELIVRFATIAFRRPLASEEERLLREFPFAGPPGRLRDSARRPTLEAAVKRAVLFILKSPQFLYVDLTPADQSPSQHAIASRLSFAVWDSIPDEALFDAASSGQLATREQIEVQARRMVADPRAKAKMHGFFRHWLEIEQRDLAKDQQMFPRFDEGAIADLRHSLEQFIDQVVWSEASDYRQLLLADYLMLNRRLRDLYQPKPRRSPGPVPPAPKARPVPVFPPEPPAPVKASKSDPPLDNFDRVAFPSGQRAGVLTHPYLLSAFAYHDNTSPIHRGVFLTRNIIGRSIKPPPIAVAFKNDEFAPDLTMREKITQLTRDKACMSCHSVINSLGFALENFDPIGRWRTRDNNKPVDAKSQYTTVEGKTVEFLSARDIANHAVGAESAHRSFVTHLFHHLAKQNPDAYGPDAIDRLRADFAADGFNIRNLLVRIAMLSTSHNLPPTHN